MIKKITVGVLLIIGVLIVISQIPTTHYSSILKIIVGVLMVIAAFGVPSLILAIRYKARAKKETKKEAAEEKEKTGRKLTLRELWWRYFKPLAAIPVAWYVYHLILYLMFPDISRLIWDFHWSYLMAAELSLIVINSIINKNTPFEERTSRKLMLATYVQTFIVLILVIGFRIGWSETAANLDRLMLATSVKSRTEFLAEETEKLIKAHRTKSTLEKMDRLREKAKKLGESDEKTRAEFFSEYEKMEAWKAEVQKEYAVLEEQKIDWRKFWPFSRKTEIRDRSTHRLSGIFELPANVAIIDRDVNGRELRYYKGERIQLQQLNSPPEPLTFVNHKTPSWTRSQKVCTSGPATEDGKVELMSPERKSITVQVRIISHHF